MDAPSSAVPMKVDLQLTLMGSSLYRLLAMNPPRLCRAKSRTLFRGLSTRTRPSTSLSKTLPFGFSALTILLLLKAA